jgi:Mg-chelatase subunit ChlD
MVMVDGKVVVNDGKLTTADESEILHKARKWSEKISTSPSVPQWPY